MSTPAAQLNVAIALKQQAETLAALQKITSAIDGVKKTALGIGGAFLGFAGLNQIKDGLEGVIKLGSAMVVTRAKTGLAIEDQVRFRAAVKAAGGDANEAANAVFMMGRALVDAAQNGGPAASALAQLKLDPNGLLATPPIAQVEALATALNGIENPALRARLATDIFGRGAPAMLPLIDNARAIRTLSEDAGEFGRVMARNATVFDDFDNMLGKVKGIGQKFWAGILDSVPLADITEAGNAWLKAFDFTKAGQKVGDFFAVAIREIRQGRMTEFLSLTIEAGIDTGIQKAKELWDGFVSYLLKTFHGVAHAIYQSLWNAIADALGNAQNSLPKSPWKAIYQDILGLNPFGESNDRFDVLNKQLEAAARNNAITTRQLIDAKEELLAAFNLGGQRGTEGESPTAYIQRVIDSRKAAMESAEALLRSAGQIPNELAEGQGKAVKKTHELTEAQHKLNELLAEQERIRNKTKPSTTTVPPNPTNFFNVGLAASQAELKAKTELGDYEKQRALLQVDFSKTETEKYGERIALINQQRGALEELIQTLTDLKTKTFDAAELQKLEGRIGGAEDQLGGLGVDQAQLGPDPNSWRDQWVSVLTEIRGHFTTWAIETSTLLKDALDTGTNAFSQNMAQALVVTGDFNAALRNMRQTILVDLTQAILKMGTDWLLQKTLMIGKEILFGTVARSQILTTAATGAAARTTETVASSASAATTAAAWSPAAILASIGSYGVAGVVGLAVVLAALGALAAGAFADGGMIKGPGGPKSDNLLAMVSPGEGVITAEATRHYGGEAFVNSINAMKLPVSTGAPLRFADGGMVASGLGTPAGSQTVNVPAPVIYNILVADLHEAALAAQRSPAGAQITISHVQSGRTEIGIPS